MFRIRTLAPNTNTQNTAGLDGCWQCARHSLICYPAMCVFYSFVLWYDFFHFVYFTSRIETQPPNTDVKRIQKKGSLKTGQTQYICIICAHICKCLSCFFFSYRIGWLLLFGDAASIVTAERKRNTPSCHSPKHWCWARCSEPEGCLRDSNLATARLSQMYSSAATAS